MSESQDVIVRDSDKRFRLRIDPCLRKIGISQLIGTKDYLEIDFIGGNCITVFYPRNLEELHASIKRELLAETHLSRIQIDDIRFYVNDYIVEIDEALKELKCSSREGFS